MYANYIYHFLCVGADIDASDKFGDTALSISNKFGHKGCERHLFLFRWQQRAKDMKPLAEQGRFAHQYFDSSFPVWKKGTQAQLYLQQILPPGEFQGTSLNAPKSKHRVKSADSDRIPSAIDDTLADDGDEEILQEVSPPDNEEIVTEQTRK